MAGNLPTLALGGAWGGAFVALVVIWEIYAYPILGRETALSPIIHEVPEKMGSFEKEQEQMRSDVSNVSDHVEEVQSRQKVQMQVQRAQARANPQMDEHQVDDYLLKNGVEPNEFLRGNEMDGFENWEADDDE